MQDQPVLAPWTLILVEHMRSGRGVWTFASDWTYAWSPLLLSHSSLSLLGLSKHRPPHLYLGSEPVPSLECFPPPPPPPNLPFYFFSHYRLHLSLFLWRPVSCCHYYPILILTLPPFCPSAFPISLYIPPPIRLSFLFFLSNICMAPAGFRVFTTLTSFFTVHSFVCFFHGLGLVFRSVQGSIHGVYI